MVDKTKIKDHITVTGKRKTAVAKATIKPGTGKITVNKIPYNNLQGFHKLLIKEPIDIFKEIIGEVKFDINVNVKGGGQEAQKEASRLAIAKAFVAANKSDELKRAFLDYDKNMLVADVRRKEPNKPGDSKARANRQSSKR